MALADDKLTVGKNHARNGKRTDIAMRKVNILLSMDGDADWKNYLKYINIDLKFTVKQRLNLLYKYNKIVFELNKCRDKLLVLKQAKLDVVTFQTQTTKLTKLNHALQEQLKEEKKIIEKWLTSSKKVSQCISEQIPHQKKKVLSDCVERLNLDSRLPIFNTGRILVPKSQVVNESLKPTIASNTPESSKDYKMESFTPLPPLKNLQGASPILKDTRVIHIRGEVLAESFQSSESSNGVKCNTCGGIVHSTTDHNEFDHFKKGARLVHGQWILREYNSVKSYLHKYVEQLGLKVMFGDNSSCNTEGYGSINCEGIIFTKVAFVNGLKYNLISISQLSPRRNDIYVLDMSSLTPNGACFFAKASESINWLWHKRLSHLNFKNINKLAKENKVLGLHSLVYSKDKPCSACEKRKHHRAPFKTKQNFSIMKCLHLLHMDLFGPVSLMSINHKKYTLVIVDEYSRKNRTLIEAPRTMLNGSVLFKHFWTEAVRIACYTQNKSIIVKIHDTTPYEIFKERIPDISYFHVFGCLVFIHNHKDHLSKFDAKADDGYLLGYSFISKAFRVFNTSRQKVEETYHVTFDESMKAIRFTNTSHDEIGINDSFRYPPDEFLHEDDPSRQYQVDYDVSYYVIPHRRSLTELTQENLVPEVIALNEPDIPLTEDN
nr:retrovirus-related Pol polyprotein from transposon TNT 1-94 [Tanacetum cinerariifolium]